MNLLVATRVSCLFCLLILSDSLFGGIAFPGERGQSGQFFWGHFEEGNMKRSYCPPNIPYDSEFCRFDFVVEEEKVLANLVTRQKSTFSWINYLINLERSRLLKVHPEIISLSEQLKALEKEESNLRFELARLKSFVREEQRRIDSSEEKISQMQQTKATYKRYLETTRQQLRKVEEALENDPDNESLKNLKQRLEGEEAFDIERIEKQQDKINEESDLLSSYQQALTKLEERKSLVLELILRKQEEVELKQAELDDKKENLDLNSRRLQELRQRYEETSLAYQSLPEVVDMLFDEEIVYRVDLLDQHLADAAELLRKGWLNSLWQFRHAQGPNVEMKFRDQPWAPIWTDPAYDIGIGSKACKHMGSYTVGASGFHHRIITGTAYRITCDSLNALYSFDDCKAELIQQEQKAAIGFYCRD